MHSISSSDAESTFEEKDSKETTERSQGKPLSCITRCGILPPGSRVEDFHIPPAHVHSRNKEGLYWQNFYDTVKEKEIDENATDFSLVSTIGLSIPSEDALDAFQKQTLFFKSVDNFVVDNDPPKDSPRSSARQTPYEQEEVTSKTLTFNQRVTLAINDLSNSLGSKIEPSQTVVMEAAFFLLSKGLLDVPDLKKVNVKQSRAFLFNAVWLQEYMHQGGQ